MYDEIHEFFVLDQRIEIKVSVPCSFLALFKH